MLELLRSTGQRSTVLLLAKTAKRSSGSDLIAMHKSAGDWQPHIGHGNMSRQTSVDGFNNWGNDALGMNQHVRVIRRRIEEMAAYRNLKPEPISEGESAVSRKNSFSGV